MSYITTKNQYIIVAGNQTAYRELGKSKVQTALGHVGPFGRNLGQLGSVAVRA